MAPSKAEFIILDSVGSTNNYAMGLAQKGLAEHGTACFAHEQVSGKGRRGKAWSSEPGTNLIISIIIKPTINVSQQFQLSAAVAVAGHKLLTKYIEDVKIKWLNDLYWRDRKAGGILIENVLRGKEWQWAIAGIGININQTVFPTDLLNPVSLKQITGKDLDVIELGKELRDFILAECSSLENNGFASMLEYFNTNLYKSGEIVKLKKGNAIFETMIIGIGAEGRLMVKDTMERSFGLDEIEWVLV